MAQLAYAAPTGPWAAFGYRDFRFLWGGGVFPGDSVGVGGGQSQPTDVPEVHLRGGSGMGRDHGRTDVHRGARGVADNSAGGGVGGSESIFRDDKSSVRLRYSGA